MEFFFFIFCFYFLFSLAEVDGKSREWIWRPGEMSGVGGCRKQNKKKNQKNQKKN